MTAPIPEQPQSIDPIRSPTPGDLPTLPGDLEENLDYGREVVFVPDERRFLPWIAALASRRIPYSVAYEDNRRIISVLRPHARQALAELTLYEEVNTDWPRVPQPSDKDDRPLVTDAAFFAIILAGTALAKFHQVVEATEARRWQELGRNDSVLFFRGHWWRTITSLTLHADAAHLISNLAWGAVLGALVASDLGVGAGLFAMLLAGVAGNCMATFLADEGYRSLGASTMVFGILGILCAIRTWEGWQRAWGEQSGRLTRFVPWLPILAGVAIFGIYGAAPGADLLGHTCGFVAGIVIGALQPGCRNAYTSRTLQFFLGSAAAGVVVFAWRTALTHG
ncbi:MAG TPA: rhomboid family intramembrane serine protease [Lentisphaeria bacterium]|nr:rhomboid family intramembrane serine protease [Lentisphaeria bacterium]